jgi:hypothetical protein
VTKEDLIELIHEGRKRGTISRIALSNDQWSGYPESIGERVIQVSDKHGSVSVYRNMYLPRGAWCVFGAQNETLLMSDGVFDIPRSS